MSFEGFTLEAEIGRGGFGTVWRARSPARGGTVALKFLASPHADNEKARLRSEVELIAASAVTSNPHVVRVLGGGVTSVPYIVMEYVPGTDLQQQLEAGPLSIQDTITVASAVSDALSSLEDVGVIHRDIKPGNVLVSIDGTLKLTDFGIAKIVGDAATTAATRVPLSLAYAAPEVWEGKATQSSDLYSLGAMLYQCLVGEPPFRGSPADLYWQHTNVDADLSRLPRGTPAGLSAIIQDCLRKNPADRPSSAREIS